jgi:hypothetical protein
MIEATISLVIVSGMVLASMNAVSGAVQSAQRGPDMHRATRLAEDLLHEILSQHYEEPEDSGMVPFADDLNEVLTGDRSRFDDVDDFNNWSASPPQMRSGLDIESAEGWTRGAIVSFVEPDTLLDSASETGMKMITIQVKDPAGVVTTLVGLRSRAGTPDRASFAREYANWLDVSVQAGAQGKTLFHTSAVLANQPTRPSANLVTNGDFEDGVNPWRADSGVTLQVNSSDVAAGAFSLDILNVGLLEDEGAYQELDASRFRQNTTYVARMNGRSINLTPATVTFYLVVEAGSRTETIVSDAIILPSPWLEFSQPLYVSWRTDDDDDDDDEEAASTPDKVFFGIRSYGAPIRIDNVTLAESN